MEFEVQREEYHNQLLYPRRTKKNNNNIKTRDRMITIATYGFISHVCVFVLSTIIGDRFLFNASEAK